MDDSIPALVKGVETLKLDLSAQSTIEFQRVLECIRTMNVTRLRSILQDNPDLDLCQTFETSELSGIFKDFNFARGAKLEQNLYLFCFDQLGDPAKCGIISEMIVLLHHHGFKCTRQRCRSHHLSLVNVTYLIQRRISLATKRCPRRHLQGYLNLSASVHDHSVSWFQDVHADFSSAAVPTKPTTGSHELWEVDIFIAVELRDHQKVEALLQYKKGFNLGTMIGPVLDEGEFAGPPTFVAYPAVYLAMINGDVRMIQLLSPSVDDFKTITRESLLMLKFLRSKNVFRECREMILSNLTEAYMERISAGAEYVLAAALVVAAEKRDHALFKKEMLRLSRLRREDAEIIRETTKRVIGLTSFPGSCRTRCHSTRVIEEQHECVKAMENPQLQNQKSLSIVVLQNADAELLKILRDNDVPLYDVELELEYWSSIVLYSSVMYDAVKSSLEREDHDFLTLLMTPGLGDYVAPMAMYHAAHQNDMDLMTTLIERFGDTIMHWKLENGKTCHQISLLEFEECCPSHRKEVQKRLMDKLNKTSMYQGVIGDGGSASGDTLTVSQLMNLYNGDFSAALDGGHYTKVETEEEPKSILLAYLERSSVPYDFDTFCSIKTKMKARDSSALESISSILAHAVRNADVEFLLRFLTDDDIQMDMKVLGEVEENETHLCIFKKRLESDKRLERCVEPFLCLFQDNLAFTSFCCHDKSSSLAMFHGKEGNSLTGFEEKLLDNAIEWLSDRHDRLPQLAHLLTQWDPEFSHCFIREQLEIIYHYVKSKKPDLLTSTNELGMNLPMYCADSIYYDHADMILYMVNDGLFDINAKAEVSSREVIFDLQHIHGRVRSGKERNTVIERGQARLKKAKVLNKHTGEYQLVKKPKFKNSGFISTHRIAVSEGTFTKRSHLMIMGRLEKRKTQKSERIRKAAEEKEEKEQSEFIPEHLDTTSLITEGSGLRSTGGRKYKMCSDVETQAADLGGSNLDDILTSNYAVNTNVLSLALKNGNKVMSYQILGMCPKLDVMHRDNERVSPLILAVKNFQGSKKSKSYGLPIVELILQHLDEQISKLSKYDSWVTCKGVNSTRDYLLQDFDESDGEDKGKTARQIAEEWGWTKMVELIDSRLNSPQCEGEAIPNEFMESNDRN